VQRFEERKVSRDWLAEAESLKDVDQLRLLWAEASKAGAAPDILEKVKAYASALSAPSLGQGADTGVPAGAKSKRSGAK
jgi:hypothetical protein